jgi:hypothetical protein
MENDVQILREIAAQGIRMMQVNALVTSPHDLQTSVRFDKFGLYNLMQRVELAGDDGAAVSVGKLTYIGTWFVIKPEDAKLTSLFERGSLA